MAKMTIFPIFWGFLAIFDRGKGIFLKNGHFLGIPTRA